MIETREDWEHVKTVAELQSGPSLQHAVDLIEALRKLAKVTARFSGRMGQSIGIGAPNNMRRIDFTNEEWVEFQKAHAALPGWIKQNGR